MGHAELLAMALAAPDTPIAETVCSLLTQQTAAME